MDGRFLLRSSSKHFLTGVAVQPSSSLSMFVSSEFIEPLVRTEWIRWRGSTKEKLFLGKDLPSQTNESQTPRHSSSHREIPSLLVFPRSAWRHRRSSFSSTFGRRMADSTETKQFFLRFQCSARKTTKENLSQSTKIFASRTGDPNLHRTNFFQMETTKERQTDEFFTGRCTNTDDHQRR